MSRRQIGAAAVAGVVGALSLATTSTATAQPTSASARSPQLVADFNRDGYADLVVGVPGEDLPGASNAGAVNVIYGSAAGLRSPGNQLWTQNSPGIAGHAESGDQFGFSVAAQDFNGDGYTDLAVGVPYEDLAHSNDGAVNVIYGSPSGLRAAGNELWTQNSPGIGGVSEAGDLFGYSLAAANFGRGGYADLAVGVPGEDQARSNDGAVNVIYGSSTGLTQVGDQVWWQNSPGIGGVAEAGDEFGYSLAAGNLGRNGYADLAVGVPFEDQAARNDGAVNVIYGSSTGLTQVGDQVWWQNSPGIGGVAEAYDEFGYSLAIDNLGRNGYADLAVGVPFEDQAGKTNSGAVNVIYGGSNGLTWVGNQVWWQDSPGVLGVAESYDSFGYSLAAANFGRGGYADLAVGVPFEDQAGKTNSGAVNVIYGGSNGLTQVGDQVWWQDSPGVLGVAESYDEFGYSLTAANFGRGGYADLAVGVPFEDQAGKTNSGAVNVLYGAFAGLTQVGDQVWWQDSPGILGAAQAGDTFGKSVGARHP